MRTTLPAYFQLFEIASMHRFSQDERDLSWQDKRAMTLAKQLWASENWNRYLKKALLRISNGDSLLAEDLYQEYAVLRLPHLCDEFIPDISGSLEQYTSSVIQNFARKHCFEMYAKKKYEEHLDDRIGISNIDEDEYTFPLIDLLSNEQLTVWCLRFDGRPWKSIALVVDITVRRAKKLHIEAQVIIEDYAVRLHKSV